MNKLIKDIKGLLIILANPSSFSAKETFLAMIELFDIINDNE